MWVVLAVLGCGRAAPTAAAAPELNTALGTVSPRFLSVALDASQLVGGKWWSPTGQVESGFGQTRISPYDFSRPRLRKLAAALAPAVLRIGGSEADVIHYDLSESPGPTPEGSDAVLDRTQWNALSAFARELDFQILFTLNAGPSARGADRRWNPENARGLVEYAAAQGDPVLGWELGNEINGYPFIFGNLRLTGADYARDFAIARTLVDEAMPAAKLAGPASAFWPGLGELSPVLPEFLSAAGTKTDLLTWHYYPQQSRRCPVHVRPAGEKVMLEPSALDDANRWAEGLERQRRRDAPQAQLWLGEVGNAQCGGEPGVSDRFAGTLWWLDALGQMARAGNQVVARQTLSGSDYGLLDDESLEPRPDFWASVLWKRLMGPQVLDARHSGAARVRVYAHCAAQPPGVVMLAINLDTSQPAQFDPGISGSIEAWSLTAGSLDAQTVELNQVTLQLAPDGSLPPLASERRESPLALPPLSATFLLFPGADAPACH
jgi:heparanase 1